MRASLRPAGHLDERSGTTRGGVEAVEPGDRVRPRHIAEPVAVTLGMLAGAIAREPERHRPGARPPKGPVVAHVDPRPSGDRLALARIGTGVSLACMRAPASTWARIRSTRGRSRAAQPPT